MTPYRTPAEPHEVSEPTRRWFDAVDSALEASWAVRGEGRANECWPDFFLKYSALTPPQRWLANFLSVPGRRRSSDWIRGGLRRWFGTTTEPESESLRRVFKC